VKNNFAPATLAANEQPDLSFLRDEMLSPRREMAEIIEEISKKISKHRADGNGSLFFRSFRRNAAKTSLPGSERKRNEENDEEDGQRPSRPCDFDRSIHSAPLFAHWSIVAIWR